MCKRMRMIALTIGLSAVLCFGGCSQNENSESATKQESTTSAETSKKSSGTGKNTTKKKTAETSKKVSETKADSTKDNNKTDIKSEVTKNETSKKVADNKNNSSNKNTGNSNNNNNNNGNGTKPSSDSTNGNSSKPADNSGNQNAAKPSNNASNNSLNTNNTGNSSGINNGETPETIKKEETVHNHDWIKQTHEIHHEATGHYEEVVVQEAWDEPVYDVVWRAICNGCGADITDCITEHGKSQMLAGNYACGAYTNTPVESIIDYIHHDAVTESKWVEDTVAYNETIVDGYKCSSCGATK